MSFVNIGAKMIDIFSHAIFNLDYHFLSFSFYIWSGLSLLECCTVVNVKTQIPNIILANDPSIEDIDGFGAMDMSVDYAKELRRAVKLYLTEKT